MRSFFNLNWVPFMEILCEKMCFVSPAAKNIAEHCKDHHTAWQLLETLHKGTVQELVLPHLRKCLRQGLEISVSSYMDSFQTELHKDPVYKYMFEQIFRFC